MKAQMRHIAIIYLHNVYFIYPFMIFQKINSYYTPYTVVFSDGITNYTFDYSYYDSTFTYAGASAVTD